MSLTCDTGMWEHRKLLQLNPVIITFALRTPYPFSALVSNEAITTLELAYSSGKTSVLRMHHMQCIVYLCQSSSLTFFTPGRRHN